MTLRIAFMGTPDFAVPALNALVAAGHDVARVYTQPPRAAGRGQKARPSPVQTRADALGLAVRAPAGLKDPVEQAAFAALDLDAAVVVAYGLILPRAILNAPRFGCVNVHASLLPRWRGAAPIQRAIEAGDAETGVTIMAMEPGLDTGPMLLGEAVPIGPADTAGDLHDRLAALGAALIVPALEGLAAGTLSPRPQPREGVTYAHKVDKAEARIDWTRPAETLDRAIRAFSPVPGAWCDIAGKRIKVLKAAPLRGDGPPGTALDDALTVACGTGALALERLQPAGKPPMPASAFLNGTPVPAGTLLG